MGRARGYGPALALACGALLALLVTDDQFALTLVSSFAALFVLTLWRRGPRAGGSVFQAALVLTFLVFAAAWWLLAPSWNWGPDHGARLAGVSLLPLGYLALVVALLALLWPSVGRGGAELRIDTALLAAAATLVIAEVVVRPSEPLVQTVADHVVFLVIPIAMAVAVGLAVWLVAGARWSASAWLLLAGTALAMIADLGFVLSGGVYSRGVIVAWSASYVLVGSGVVDPSFPELLARTRSGRHRAWASFSLGVVALVAVGVVILRGTGPSGIGTLSAFAAVSILVLVVSRLYLLLAERERHVAVVEHRALHDELTGLPNRALLRERLTDLAERAGASAQTFAVVFLDLDGFKRVNDEFGHAAGDRLLVDVANQLGRSARPGDTVGRYAGDEFVVIAPWLEGAEARRFAERLREELGAVQVPTGAPVGASVGAAVVRGPGDVDACCTPPTRRCTRRRW